MNTSRRSTSRPIERIVYLDQLIRSGQCRSASQAARQLEVSVRTIERDFDLLRDRFGAPLIYDPREHRWVYEEKSYVLPYIQMTEGELVAIFFAERLLKQYTGTPFEKQIRAAFEKMAQFLPEQISIDLSAYREAYSFEIGPVSDVDAAAFARISRATMHRQALEIEYFTQSRGVLTKRRVDPYHLHNHRGDWYVIAYDHLRRAVRDFHLGRIRGLRETESTFAIPSDFDLKAYLATGFEMIKGERLYAVEIEFDAYQARWIRERRRWHATEERVELGDGRLLLRMRVGGLDAIQRFVLQYGHHARVLAPDELRQRVCQEIEAMRAGYACPSVAAGTKAIRKRGRGQR